MIAIKAICLMHLNHIMNFNFKKDESLTRSAEKNCEMAGDIN